MQYNKVMLDKGNTGINRVSHLWFHSLAAVECLIFFILTVKAVGMQLWLIIISNKQEKQCEKCLYGFTRFMEGIPV